MKALCYLYWIPRLLSHAGYVLTLKFRIFPGLIRLPWVGWIHFRRQVREREPAHQDGRLDDRGLMQSVQRLLEHLQHVNTLPLRRHFTRAVQSVEG